MSLRSARGRVDARVAPAIVITTLLWRFFLPGGYQPDKIITGLAPCLGQPDNHLAGFHVFTFNDLGPTEEWRRQSLRRLRLHAAGPALPRPGAGKPEPEHA